MGKEKNALFKTEVDRVQKAILSADKIGRKSVFCTVDFWVMDAVVHHMKELGYKVYRCRTILGSVEYLFVWGKEEKDFSMFLEV